MKLLYLHFKKSCNYEQSFGCVLELLYRKREVYTIMEAAFLQKKYCILLQAPALSLEANKRKQMRTIQVIIINF